MTFLAASSMASMVWRDWQAWESSMTAVPGKNLRNVADASVRSKNLRNVADEWFEMVSDDSGLAKTRTEQSGTEVVQ